MNDRSYVTHNAAEVAESLKAGTKRAAAVEYAKKSATPIIACDASGLILGILDPKDLVTFDAKQQPVYDQQGALLGLADPTKIQKTDQPAPAQPAAPTPAAPAAPPAS